MPKGQRWGTEQQRLRIALVYLRTNITRKELANILGVDRKVVYRILEENEVDYARKVFDSAGKRLYRCPKCEGYFHDDKFTRQSNSCVRCVHDRERLWRNTHQKVVFRHHPILKLLPYESFIKLSKERDNRCEICDKQVDRLHIDHDHVTNSFRGLLCPSCNRGLGQMYDDPIILRKAARYIERRRQEYA